MHCRIRPHSTSIDDHYHVFAVGILGASVAELRPFASYHLLLAAVGSNHNVASISFVWESYPVGLRKVGGSTRAPVRACDTACLGSSYTINSWIFGSTPDYEINVAI